MRIILVVDDDVRIVKMLERRLKKMGYKILTAENSRGGIFLALLIQPDLILMDMYMPETDGYETTRVLREHKYGGLICALTAATMVSDVNAAMGAGCDHFISKPFGPDFEKTIQTILDEKR